MEGNRLADIKNENEWGDLYERHCQQNYGMSAAAYAALDFEAKRALIERSGVKAAGIGPGGVWQHDGVPKTEH